VAHCYTTTDLFYDPYYKEPTVLRELLACQIRPINQPLLITIFVSAAGRYVNKYIVSHKKTVQNYFCRNFVIFQATAKIFGITVVKQIS